MLKPKLEPDLFEPHHNDHSYPQSILDPPQVISSANATVSIANSIPVRNRTAQIPTSVNDKHGIDLTANKDSSRESSVPPTQKKRPRSTTGLDERATPLSSDASSTSRSTSPGSLTLVPGGKRAKQFVSAVKVPRLPRPQPTADEIQRRDNFLRNLAILEDVTLRNDIDNDTPPIDFEFVAQSKLGEGVYRATEDVMLGCGCQKKYKQPAGCVYLDYCSCIEDSALDNSGKKCFPYGASENNYRCLRDKVLKTRNHIYECNSRCDCTLRCKNRVVQHGRQVPLQIFKTVDRAWGLRCMDDLKKGQFIDTYRGEIITSDEADRRGRTRQPDEPNFFFDFDKFDGTDAYDPSRPYVCDGQYMGSPSRFINHSCEPNCRLFTVSYNHNDRNIYELAFFALFDLDKGTELTFDYHDKDEETWVMNDEMADEQAEEKGYRPTKCLCGSSNCRGYFFP